MSARGLSRGAHARGQTEYKSWLAYETKKIIYQLILLQILSFSPESRVSLASCFRFRSMKHRFYELSTFS